MGNTPPQPNWTIDESFGMLRLSGRLVGVRLRVRQAEEDFHRHTPAREFVPLTVQAGRRTVVIARFYTTELDLMPAGLGQPRIGNGEAYYYHADAILLLWRCNLLERFRTANPADDDTLHALWDGFEAFLLRYFPDARQMVTPAWNRPYDETRWQEFLRRHRFTHRSPAGISGAALIKNLSAH